MVRGADSIHFFGIQFIYWATLATGDCSPWFTVLRNHPLVVAPSQEASMKSWQRSAEEQDAKVRKVGQDRRGHLWNGVQGEEPGDGRNCRPEASQTGWWRWGGAFFCTSGNLFAEGTEAQEHCQVCVWVINKAFLVCLHFCGFPLTDSTMSCIVTKS